MVFITIQPQADKSIIDQIAIDDSIGKATVCLSAVEPGTVPAWIRLHQALSNGEQFRTNLAKTLVDELNRLIIDEFKFGSAVYRQIACIGASACTKAWKRTACGKTISIPIGGGVVWGYLVGLIDNL